MNYQNGDKPARYELPDDDDHKQSLIATLAFNLLAWVFIILMFAFLGYAAGCNVGWAGN